MSDDDIGGTGPFSFEVFEVVRVRPGGADNPVPSRGTVLGRARGDDGAEFYAVWFDDRAETSMVALADLEPTGERRPREDFYDGSHLRVSRRGEPV